MTSEMRRRLGRMLRAAPGLRRPRAARRREDEEARRESAERTRLILDNVLDAVIAIDVEGRIISWNPQAERVFGWGAAEVIGRRLVETIVPPAYREAHEHGFRRFRETGEGPALNRRMELTALRRDGTEFPAELSITPVHLEGSTIFSAFVRDIAAQKRAEEELRRTEESFQLLFANNPLPMWVYDVATLYFLEVNAAAIAHYGYSREEFLRMRITDIRPPEDAPRVRAAVAASSAAANHAVRRHETTWRHRLKGGRLRDVDIASQRLTFAGREAAIVVAADVTDLKEAEKSLTRYATRLSVLHDIDRAIIAADAPSAIAEVALWRLRDLLGVPRAIVNLFDFETGEVTWLAAVGRRRSRVGPGVRYPLQLAGDLEALRKGGPQIIDITSLPPSPDTDALLASDVRFYMVVPMLAEGELVGSISFGGPMGEFPPEHVGIAQEVAAQLAIAIEQARLRERVVAAERQYREIFENAAEGIFRSTPAGRYLLVNPAMAKIYGYASPEEMVESITDIARELYVNGEERQEILRQLDQHGVASRVECRARRTDGAVIWVSQTVRAVRDIGGQLLYYEGNIEDITERKRTEAMLRHNEKLASMSAMVAGVAHELNNPLSVVTGQAQLLRDEIPAGPLAARIDRVGKAADRCARIVRNFLTLAREQPPERRRVQINQIVQEAIELLAYPLRIDDVQVECDLAADVPWLSADPHQLHQVLVNLIVNAHHALRDAPTPRELMVRTTGNGDQHRVRIEVSDTGPGIPLEIQPRIFEPFFTTKPVGVGTGLGLSLCHGIVTSHGGRHRSSGLGRSSRASR